MLQSPVLYRDDIETPSSDETHVVESLTSSLDEILETTHADYGHAVRAVHAKGHGVMRGTFTIPEGLSRALAQGLFSRPGSHPAWIRLSTNPGDILDDAVSLPRGLALKVGEVEGERLPGAQGHTQDFVMINGPAFIVPDAKAFSGSLKVLAKTTDAGEGAKVALSSVLQAVNGALAKIGLESTLLASMGGAPQVNPLGETYYSALPFRYGAHVAKFRLRPISPDLTALSGSEVDLKGNPDGIRETVRAQMADRIGRWSFEVQLARDLAKQPIEDASAIWDEAEAPFEQVAILSVEPQDAWSPEAVEEINERMRFSPWTGLAAHRPLGNVNRARRDTYRHSAAFRAARNRCPIHEP